MIKRYLFSLLLAFVLLVVSVGGIVLAAYSSDIIVTENGTASYDMLGCNVTANIDYMATNNWFADPEGRDTRVLLGGQEKPHMLADDKLMFAIPVAKSSSQTVQFVTGYANQDFHIIPGYGGYITTTDNETIEPGDNFTISQHGWFNTDNGTDKNLVIKQDVFKTFVSGTVAGNVTSQIGIPQLDNDFHIDDWTDVGTPRIQVSVPNRRLDYDSRREAIDQRCWKDVGLMPDTHWRLDFTWKPVSHPADGGNFFNFGLWSSNTKPNGYAGDLIVIAVETLVIRAKQIDSGGASTFSGNINFVYGTTYYVTLERNTAILATLSVYSDVARTTHIAGSPQTLVIPATNIDLRYLQASNFDGVAAGIETGWITNVNPSATVTATSVSSGEHTVTTDGAALIWAPGEVLKFDGTANSQIDYGVLYNHEGQFWVSLWLKLDGAYGSGAPVQYVWSKHVDSANTWRIELNNGYVRFYCRHGGITYFDILAPIVSWNADTWHHILCSSDNISNTNRRIVDGAVSTGGTSNGTATAGNVRIGSIPGTGGFIGTIANVICGTDNLTPAEELALYQNTFPGDETDLWYIDEGTGTNIVSYGSAGNAGTTNIPPCSWAWETRPCKFTISIDGAYQDSFARTISVPDNSENWTWMQNSTTDFFPYADNTTMSINGTQQLLYRPNAYIRGVTLPDLMGTTQDGIFSWGANPTGVNITMGSFLPDYEPVIGAGELATPDVVPVITEPDTMYVDDTTAETAMEGDPLYPWFHAWSDTTGISILLMWWMFYTIFALIAFMVVYKYSRNLMIAGSIFVAVIGYSVARGLMPFWIVIILALMLIAFVMMERRTQV